MEGVLTAISVEMLLLLESISQPGSGKEEQSGETSHKPRGPENPH